MVDYDRSQHSGVWNPSQSGRAGAAFYQSQHLREQSHLERVHAVVDFYQS